ncbi:MAG: thioredoxin family protein, partial [Bdellovibrionales bacterium]|nr:thioredoxin family protein [Bdellovibrionales bacterium]
LMPCVFPVLSIKILSFVKKAGKEQNKVRRHGLAFAFGILLSFWILAIVIRSLRAAGEHLGWGFQLQEPAFVAALVLLLVAVALNLFGVFEFGSSIQRACGSIETKGEGYFTSFLSGVLATVLATPCTAPFMGGALAFALSTTLIPSLAVFTALALGLATPYLLFSFFPALLSQLPKPGLWMETLREFMGFPVLLTALWLIWVFQQQSDAGAILSLLAAVLLLSFALWVYGKICPPTASRKRQIGGLLLVMASLISCAWIGLPLQRPGRSELQTPQSNENTNISIDKHGLAWHRYSQSVIDSAIKDGQAVFIDFTAAWCVTCQVNKKVVFSSSEVTHTIREKNILLVRGDWTNEDPVITDALRQFNRVGVPLNVLYNPKTPEDPVVFPSVLTPQLVLDEFRKLQ